MSAHTKVRMTFEVTFAQPWGEDCTVSQIRKQTLDQCADVASRITSEIARTGVAVVQLCAIDKNYTLVLPEEGR